MKTILIVVAVLIAMEGAAWWAYTASRKTESFPEKSVQLQQNETDADQQGKSEPQENVLGNFEIIDLDDPANQEKYKDLLSLDVIEYPLIQVEEINGITERTIHMGVRQWAWDLAKLEANLGEKVRLIIHNADVVHTIEIPELGVSTPIPEDGAVVEFLADKQGTFEFICGAPYCGEGHDKMRGKIIIT